MGPCSTCALAFCSWLLSSPPWWAVREILQMGHTRSRTVGQMVGARWLAVTGQSRPARPVTMATRAGEMAARRTARQWSPAGSATRRARPAHAMCAVTDAPRRGRVVTIATPPPATGAASGARWRRGGRAPRVEAAAWRPGVVTASSREKRSARTATARPRREMAAAPPAAWSAATSAPRWVRPALPRLAAIAWWRAPSSAMTATTTWGMAALRCARASPSATTAHASRYVETE